MTYMNNTVNMYNKIKHCQENLIQTVKYRIQTQTYKKLKVFRKDSYKLINPKKKQVEKTILLILILQIIP